VSRDNSEFPKQRSRRALENSEFPNTQSKCNFRDSNMRKLTVTAWISRLADTNIAGRSFSGELRLQRNTRRSFSGELGVLKHTVT
jgi:hypothetical protein